MLRAFCCGISRRMRCYVYKSLNKADTYVYLAEREGFARLPEALRLGLGQLQFVLECDLSPERRLAREDPAVVRANLGANGFHLQLPPGQAGWVPVTGGEVWQRVAKSGAHGRA
jgi:uncharacterized protein YcgL (UPF0745 family)